MKVSLSQIKSWFKKGLYPTESQFSNTWDSFWHKDDKLSLNSIEGLIDVLNKKANSTLLDAKADKEHLHEDYLTKEDIVDKQDVRDDNLQTNSKIITSAINELNSKLGVSIKRSYTLDFGTVTELVQDVNMTGNGVISRISVRNVLHLFVTTNENARQEVDFENPNLFIPEGEILIWEIVREKEDELACVGVLLELKV